MDGFPGWPMQVSHKTCNCLQGKMNSVQRDLYFIALHPGHRKVSGRPEKSGFGASKARRSLPIAGFLLG